MAGRRKFGDDPKPIVPLNPKARRAPHSCLICFRPEQEVLEIETWICSGRPDEEIAKHLQIEKRQVARHRMMHLPPKIALSKQAKEEQVRDYLFETTLNTHEDLRELMMSAASSEDFGAAASFAKHLVHILELQAPLLGQLALQGGKGQGAAVQVNIGQPPSRSSEVSVDALYSDYKATAALPGKGDVTTKH